MDIRGSRGHINLILSKLPKETIAKGMRTFEINGMKNAVTFDNCFVAMMYGEQKEFNEVVFNINELDACPFPTIEWDEMMLLSTAHFDHPEMVFEEATEVLAS